MARLFLLSSAQPCSSDGFINLTTATDEQLESLWVGAQKALATQPIDIDPLGSDPHTVAPDNKALDQWPGCQVEVRTTPGPFAAPQSPTGYANGETMGAGPWIIQVNEQEVLNPGVTGWEMENVILEKLGISVKGR